MTNKIDKLEYLKSRVSDLEESRGITVVWIITLIVLIIIIGSFIGVLYDEVNDLEQSQPYESCSFRPDSWILDKTKIYKIEINKDRYTVKNQNGEILESWFCDKQPKEVKDNYYKCKLEQPIFSNSLEWSQNCLNNAINSKENTQNLCIGWANHKVLEKEAYHNSFGTNINQQKYWISVYEKCMEDYKE